MRRRPIPGSHARHSHPFVCMRSIGPLDKFGWPERVWACEREHAARLAPLLAHSRNVQRSPPSDRPVGIPASGALERLIIDPKELTAMDARPEQFARCPMIRRELYGLPHGDGVHFGPAVQDALWQALLNAVC